jgi:hypothetical protein
VGIGLSAESLEIEARAHRLMSSLALAVPGNLGSMVRAILGVSATTERGREGEAALATSVGPWAGVEASEGASGAQLIINQRDADHTGPEVTADIKPPARPVGWASRLLTLCCNVYGQPVERAVPMGACLELLGITSSALDAAQDGHDDLMRLYAVGQPLAQLDSASERNSAGLEVALRDMLPQNSGAIRRAALVSNASLTLVGLAWQVLLEHGPRYGVEGPTLLEIGRLIADRLVRICQAQHLDLTVGRASPAYLSLEEYERIIEGKTGEIDGTVCEVAALLAGAAAYRGLWRTVGLERAVAQQLYDDYIDLTEDISRGGQIGHPVLYGLAVAGAAQRRTIFRLLERARSSGAGDLEAARELVALLQEMGAEYYTLTCMVVHRKRALAALESLKLPAEAHEWLYEWILQVAPIDTTWQGAGRRAGKVNDP